MKLKKLLCCIATAFFVISNAACAPSTQGDKMEQNVAELSEGGKNKIRLMNYLQNEVWGKSTLSGQMDLTWADKIDMLKKVYDSTGKYPAISGYDFMNVGLGWDGARQTQEALNWWKDAKGTGKHGIVTFCWHWRDPNKSGGDFYAEKIAFRIPMKDGKLNTASRDFKKIQRDLDKVAAELATLRDQGVPILWRPMHEAGGDPLYNNPWFWWGASGNNKTERATAYKALYTYMHNYFTNEKALDNLIWVWNGQVKEYYPGDEYVDIIAEDIYPNPKDYSSQKTKFNNAKKYTTANKMIALSENGVIPHPKNMEKDNAQWLWFMTWNDGNQKGTNNSNFWEGEYYNPDSHKKEVYSHKKIITLDQLPDLQNYPME